MPNLKGRIFFVRLFGGEVVNARCETEEDSCGYVKIRTEDGVVTSVKADRDLLTEFPHRRLMSESAFVKRCGPLIDPHAPPEPLFEALDQATEDQ